MLLFGAGGHARVIISILKANGITPKLVFDHNPAITDIYGIPVSSHYLPSLFPEDNVIIAIGDNTIRKKIAETVSHRFGCVVHPSAITDLTATLETGTVVMHGAVIQAGTIVGKHVIINTRASIDHDCAIGDFVHIAPGAVLCGQVVVGDNTLIGAGSVIVPNIIIGKNCLITAGCVITQSVPDGAIVKGNPARIVLIKPDTA